MAKPAERAHSRAAVEAIAVIGRLIRLGRSENRMTAQELAERAGISRALLHRIERGDPSCSIGAVFEAATIVGVPLFDMGNGANVPHVSALINSHSRNRAVHSVAPQRVSRRKSSTVKDDF